MVGLGAEARRRLEVGPARVEDGTLGTFVASSWVSAPLRRAGAAVLMN